MTNYAEAQALAAKKAQETINYIKTGDSPYLLYRDMRPITDLRNMMQTSAQLYPNNPAFMQRFSKGEDFRTISFKEAWEDIQALGTALAARGLKDKRIAVVGENCYQWCVSYLAVVCGLGIVVPLDKELGETEHKGLCREAEVSAVICTKRFEERFRNIVESGETQISAIIGINAEEDTDGILSFANLIMEGKRLLAEGDRTYLDAEIDPFAMSILLFTSGTTGLAKGVMLSHWNICTDLMIAPTLLQVTDHEVFFSVLPIHHTYECTCTFLICMYRGACVAFCEGLKYIAKNLKEIHPTFVLGVPAIFESLYKGINKNLKKTGKAATVARVMKISKFTKKFGLDLNRKLLGQIYDVFGGRMKTLISGGAAIDPAILQFLNDLGFRAVQGYGLTECAPMAALNPDQYPLMRNSSVGHVMPTLGVKIENPDEDGIGEICIKGDNVMLGYYNMPEETAKVLKDGWFHTGDLGYVDKDDYIYITGRAKNVIITGNGKNVFPEELEYLLGKSPYIAESMVWAMPDEESGQDDVIAATVIPDMEEIKEALGDKADDKEAVAKLLESEVDKVNEGLPVFKQMKRTIVRYEAFDKNTSAKIKRFSAANKKH